MEPFPKKFEGPVNICALTGLDPENADDQAKVQAQVVAAEGLVKAVTADGVVTKEERKALAAMLRLTCDSGARSKLVDAFNRPSVFSVYYAPVIW